MITVQKEQKRVYMLDEFKPAGILVFEFYDNGNVGIWQDAENSATAKAFDDIEESVEVEPEKLIEDLEKIIEIIKEGLE